jgi:hypothetical protein
MRWAYYVGGVVVAALGCLKIGRLFEWSKEMVSPCLIFLTLLAIVWYSLETRGLKVQMIRQNELTLRPRLIVYAVAGTRFRVKNIGNGAALDTWVEDYLLALPGEVCIRYSFKCQNLLESGEDRLLDIETDVGEYTSIARAHALSQLQPISAPRALDIKLHYKNVNGKEYSKDTARIGKGMLEKTSFPV